MSTSDPKLNPKEKELALKIFAAERSRVKRVTPDPAHTTAVEYYDGQLLKLCKKLDPQGYRYAS